MRNSPVHAIDPADLPADDRQRIETATKTAETNGTINLADLPPGVAEQLLFALKALSRGKKVAAVADGKPLTTTEAAELLGMSRTHLTQLCDDGRIASFAQGSQRRIAAEEIDRILIERANARVEARSAASTAEERRLSRAGRAAGLRS